MREIKFRRYCGEGVWAYMTLNGDKWDFNIFPLKVGTTLNQNDWQQFTGLKDKNGKEIYEGDIIKSRETFEVFKVGEITPLSRHLDFLAENIGYFDNKGKYYRRSVGSQYHLDDWVSWPEMYEVIGNMYENPNLLT